MQKRLNLVISFDWEGLSLRPSNLERIQEFKERWAIPLVHYMNPAYFTSRELKKEARLVDWSQWIRSEDEWGLHLHTPKHFVQAAGVKQRSYPCFAVSGDSYCGEFAGQEVMLHSYNRQEFAQFLKLSFEIFINQKWPLPQTFRAGGWMMDQDKFSVLRDFGFLTDSSATSSKSLDESCWQGESLQRYLSILWDGIDQSSQPFALENILEVPNNLGAIDYWLHPKQIAKELVKGHNDENFLGVITAHQETATEYLHRLDAFLLQLKELDVEIHYKTCRDIRL